MQDTITFQGRELAATKAAHVDARQQIERLEATLAELQGLAQKGEDDAR